MRKTTVAIAVWAVALTSELAWAAGIAGTSHDLSTRLGTGQVCLPCHAPHNVLKPTAGPLWNHALSKASFTQNGAPLTLTGNSALCMGCHDGVTAVGNFNIADPRVSITPGLANLTIQNLPGANPANNVGTDLSALHVVSVVYPTASASMNPIASLGSLRLQNGKVECSTCHDPHSSTYGNFLRISNSGSALCLTCHIE
jgi:predicted CXXCH cytochrome family protein